MDVSFVMSLAFVKCVTSHHGGHPSLYTNLVLVVECRASFYTNQVLVVECRASFYTNQVLVVECRASLYTNLVLVVECRASFYTNQVLVVECRPHSSICVQLRSWVQKVLHIPIKIKVVVFYFKLYKYIV